MTYTLIGRGCLMKKYNGKSNMVGDLIKRKRIEMGMSANDVCKELQSMNVFINSAELYRIERVEMILKDFELVALCTILDISLMDIIENCLSEKTFSKNV